MKSLSKGNQFYVIIIKSSKNINFRMFPMSKKHLFASLDKRDFKNVIIGNDKLVVTWFLRTILEKM